MATNGPVRAFAIAFGIVVVGIASIAVAYAPWNVAAWTGDLLTGWVLTGAGLLAMRRTPTSSVGQLLVIAGFAWFVGDYAVLAGAAGWAGGALTWAYHGVLFHAIITVPSGRMISPFQRAAVAVGYAAALMPWLWTNPAPAIAVSLAAVGVAAVEYSSSRGVRRRSKRRALEASALLATSTAIGFAIREMVATSLASTVALVALEVTIAVAAGLLVLAAGTVSRGGELVDLVVELDDAAGAGLEGALRRVLGDPQLTIAYATADPRGRDREIAPDPGREELVIDLVNDRTATLCTVTDALAEPPLRDSVVAAIRLDAANRSLRTDVATQLDAVRASRSRLIRAADEAGRELEERVHSGADKSLTALERILHGIQAHEPEIEKPLATVQALLGDAREDLARFSAGLHPRALDELGLTQALGAAVHESAISVDLEIVEHDPVDPDIQLAAYFFCLEGLANISKHASARRAWVRVAAADGVLNLEVADDGAGGATLGSGIQGIADRIAAVGGVVTLQSAHGAGTRLIGRVPLDDAPPAVVGIRP
ncbi:hypothetical protein [Microbacterium pumilum]|uniref:Sensor histidine kinase n=1 Tax=Microbacterium pumilum TaxID=344165 RepID=A0ABP5D874_9MICO